MNNWGEKDGRESERRMRKFEAQAWGELEAQAQAATTKVFTEVSAAAVVGGREGAECRALVVGGDSVAGKNNVRDLCLDMQSKCEQTQ